MYVYTVPIVPVPVQCMYTMSHLELHFLCFNIFLASKRERETEYCAFCRVTIISPFCWQISCCTEYKPFLHLSKHCVWFTFKDLLLSRHGVRVNFPTCWEDCHGVGLSRLLDRLRKRVILYSNTSWTRSHGIKLRSSRPAEGRATVCCHIPSGRLIDLRRRWMQEDIDGGQIILLSLTTFSPS